MSNFPTFRFKDFFSVEITDSLYGHSFPRSQPYGLAIFPVKETVLKENFRRVTLAILA